MKFILIVNHIIEKNTVKLCAIKFLLNKVDSASKKKKQPNLTAFVFMISTTRKRQDNYHQDSK